MKVKILPKVSGFAYKGTDYKPGAVVEIEDRFFRGDFMEQIVEALPEPVEAEPVIEEPEVEEKPTKKTRKKKAKETVVEEAEPELAEQAESTEASEAS